MKPAEPVVTVYGIANCDTVKKARAWLAERGIDGVFHDYKKLGVPLASLERWMQSVGWETLINRKGTTWRQLDAATQAAVQDDASASALMLTHPSVIKRPVVVWRDGGVSVGFDAASFAARLP